MAALCDAMEQIAPTWAAAEWDNVGLLAGGAKWPLARVLLTIDLTPAVLDEAIRTKVGAIVSYHPPIFRPIKRMSVDRAASEGLAAEAVAHRIAVYSPHTALDCSPDGTNDVIAALAGLEDIVPFEIAAKADRLCKLVVFVPAQQVEKVSDAVFAAGAGRIGAYERCSYRVNGQGTFFGTESTSPTIGRRGRLERVDEVRLEVIFPRQRLADVTAAVRKSHPYEEPAFDVYPLEGLPDGRTGQGRIGRFRKPIALSMLAKRLAMKTGARCASRIGRSSERLHRGLVCVGAAGSLPFEIPGESLGWGDVVITGEIRHHDALRYARCGAAAIALGHSVSERPVLAPLAARLKKLLPGVSIIVSRADRDPFEAV
ncbi:MAG TPA: Nif3-like dinuclear metal center hexameric protein [Phycisphaerae bacterium]|nr:Nif3-like dinuclear metal center hexameric protein [Phycisphaerae bacterium]